MEKYIINSLIEFGYPYIKLKNEDQIITIYNLHKNDILLGDDYDDIILYHIGMYYEKNKMYDLMKQYYLLAVDQDYDHAMYRLGNYYHDIEFNYELLKKYWLMGKENGSWTCACSLLDFFKNSNTGEIINDAIEIYSESHDTTKYKFIKKLYRNSLIPRNPKLLRDYDSSTIIQSLILSYYGKLIKHKKIYNQCNSIYIMIFCINPYNIPKNIILHIICYLFMEPYYI